MLGSPIAHSRSPQLHRAAYRALGLDDWTYERIECTADELPALVSGFGPEWVGVSVTMPGKFAALRFADERTPRAELVGSANTLVRSQGGWRADNTDIDGVTGALGQASGRAIVVGSGGTAPAVVVGLAELGVQDISVVSRNREKAQPLLALAAPLDVDVRWIELGTTLVDVDVVVNTVPADAVAQHARHIGVDAGVAGRDLRSVADSAGVGRRCRRGPGDQRAGNASAPGILTGRAVHGDACAQGGDAGRAGRALAECTAPMLAAVTRTMAR